MVRERERERKRETERDRERETERERDIERETFAFTAVMPRGAVMPRRRWRIITSRPKLGAKSPLRDPQIHPQMPLWETPCARPEGTRSRDRKGRGPAT